MSNTIWVFGGILKDGNKSNELWKFDLNQQKWEIRMHTCCSKTGEPFVPEPRSGHGMTAVEIENKIIVFGGRKKENAEGDLNDLWEYDT